jgi:hypothetical protein
MGPARAVLLKSDLPFYFDGTVSFSNPPFSLILNNVESYLLSAAPLFGTTLIA